DFRCFSLVTIEIDKSNWQAFAKFIKAATNMSKSRFS
ncbi:MAG: hypothetical protein ACI9QD_000466, partial [Thermoproteota archaeon]